MAVDYARAGGRIPFEEGVAFELALPNFDAPTARLLMMRNPAHGDAYESFNLAQDVMVGGVGQPFPASRSDASVRSFLRHWNFLEKGWTQGQRIKTDGVLTATTETDVVGSTEYLSTVGFRSFDGLEPTVQLVELDGAGFGLASHSFTLGSEDLRAYPGGELTRLSLNITTNASTEKLQVKATSSGQDFLICDLHAMQADGTDSWAESDQLYDTDADGMGDAWALSSGTPDLEWYGQGATGLSQWIELISKGALVVHEYRKEGSGRVESVKLLSPLKNVGFPRRPSGSYGPAAIVFGRSS